MTKTQQNTVMRRAVAMIKRERLAALRRSLAIIDKVIRHHHNADLKTMIRSRKLCCRLAATKQLRYWRAVTALWRKLDPKAARQRQKDPLRCWALEKSDKVIWLASRASKKHNRVGGRIFQCPPWLAAQSIVNETHRLARPAEIARWEKEQGQRKAAAASGGAGATR